MKVAACLSLALLCACHGGSAPTKEAVAPLAEGAVAERTFGGASTVTAPALDVAAVLADPRPHLGKAIKCEGTVARVCQAAGCWLELRASASAGEGLRVPMAGHAFFVPQDVIGRPAIVEGTLVAQELSPAQLEHLTGEGLEAAGPLSLSATRVVVR